MSDYFLLFLSIVILLTGFLGCLLPVLPGPPLSFVAIVLIHFTRFADFTSNELIFLGALALIVQILDFIVPAWGTRKFGGSKYGMWGSVIGLIAGIIILPALGLVIGPFGLLGIIGGPFAGALIGEKIAGKNSDDALRAALGSFIGFLAGTFMKLAAATIITVYFIKEVWDHIF
jgi:uncharacterized protein YqgC (DUF456 family)